MQITMRQGTALPGKQERLMGTGLLGCNDEELVLRARQGEVEAFSQLVSRYLPMIRRRASRYPLPGLEAEDVVQEGLLGLLKAIRLYDSAQGTFGAFASLCVSSSMATLAKSALSSRQRPLMDYSSLEDDMDGTALRDRSVGPEEQLIAAEQAAELNRKISSLLSPFEQNVLKLYLSGHSYTEISQLLSSTTKAVDNALQRVRRKLRSA